jgi:hypothetical protein
MVSTGNARVSRCKLTIEDSLKGHLDEERALDADERGRLLGRESWGYGHWELTCGGGCGEREVYKLLGHRHHRPEGHEVIEKYRPEKELT